jgi:hypothetical protein
MHKSSFSASIAWKIIWRKKTCGGNAEQFHLKPFSTKQRRKLLANYIYLKMKMFQSVASNQSISTKAGVGQLALSVHP